jgi:hypothetical protein
VADTRAFIAVRPGDVAEWLGERPPSSVSAGDGSHGSPPAHIKITVPVDRFRAGRTQVVKGVIRTAVHPWARGVLSQRVTVPTNKGSLVVCRRSIVAKRARDLTLSCRLPARLRKRLRDGDLGLTVSIRFDPAQGRAERVVRRIGSSRG